MEFVPWPEVGLGSGWVLVVVVIIALTRGWLYTKPQVASLEAAHTRELASLQAAHTREIAALEAARDREVEDANHERGEWRTEARLKDQTVMELNEQNRAMLDAFGPTLTDFLEGLREAGLGHRDSGSQGGATP